MEEVLSLLLLAIVILGPIESAERRRQDEYAVAKKGTSGSCPWTREADPVVVPSASFYCPHGLTIARETKP